VLLYINLPKGRLGYNAPLFFDALNRPVYML